MLTGNNLALKANELGGALNRTFKRIPAAFVFLTVAVLISAAQDVPDSKDPAGMKRYEGSELIGYRASKFDEYLLPLGAPT
jgi:hypothetical protein